MKILALKIRERESFLSRLVILLGMICVLGVAFPAQAQNCDIIRDEIMTLRAPNFGNYTIWDHIHGGDGMEQIADFVPLEDGLFVAGGSYTLEDNDKIYKPLMFKMDRKGKLRWEVRETPKGFQSIDRVIQDGKRYIVIGDIKDTRQGDGIYMAVYSENGKRLQRFPIFEPSADLDAKAIVKASDGNGYFIAAQLEPFDTSKTGYGVIYKLSKGGKRLLRRAFSPGLDTEFNNMQAMKDGSYFVSGSIRNEDGRRAGWLLKIDNRAAIIWQRTFTRGQSAALHSIRAFQDGGYFITGQATPMRGERPSGWVARVDSSGNVFWQRYFHGPFSYSARDAMTYPDGRAVALLRGTSQKMTDRTHVRLLTFSPRGYLLNAQDYSDFQGATAFRLHQGLDGEHIFAGYSQTALDEAFRPQDVSVNTHDAWIVAVEGLDTYQDPCLPEGSLR